MKLLWNYLDKKEWKIHNKYRVFFSILMLFAGIIGYCIWLLVSLFALKTWDYMLCFIGYPMVISWFSGYLYICNHDFHNGAK